MQTHMILLQCWEGQATGGAGNLVGTCEFELSRLIKIPIPHCFPVRSCVCVCVCVCVYQSPGSWCRTQSRKRSHTRTRTCTRARTHTFINSTCTRALMNIRTHMHAYMHTCIHACMHVCIHTNKHTHIHTYIHTYIHIYIQRSSTQTGASTAKDLLMNRRQLVIGLFCSLAGLFCSLAPGLLLS
jgi:hypothetical protein